MKLPENKFFDFEAAFKTSRLISRMEKVANVYVNGGCSSLDVATVQAFRTLPDGRYGDCIETVYTTNAKYEQAQLQLCQKYLPEGMVLNDFLTLTEQEQKVMDTIKEIFKNDKFDKEKFIQAWADKKLKFKSILKNRFDLDNRNLLTFLIQSLDSNVKMKKIDNWNEELDYAHYFTYDEIANQIKLPGSDIKYLLNHKVYQLGNSTIIEAIKKKKYDLYKALTNNDFSEEELTELVELDRFKSLKFISICVNQIEGDCDFEYVVEYAQNVKQLLLHQTKNISDELLQSIIEDLTNTPMPDGTRGTLLDELQNLLTDSNIRNISKKLKDKPSSALYLYLMGLQAKRLEYNSEGDDIQHSAKFIPQMND